MKCNVYAFFENLPRKFKIDYNMKTITVILPIDLCEFMVANISFSSS